MKSKQMFSKKLDKKDIAIINELNKDARASFREIARKLGVATTTVINKYNRLKKLGIIKSTAPIIDREKVGYGLTAAIEIIVSKGKLMEVEKKIAKMPRVFAVYDITGEPDALILACFRTRAELNDFVKSLLVMPCIERTNTHFVLNTVKEDFRVFV